MKIKWAKWEEIPEGIEKSYLRLFSENKSELLISNVSVDFRILQIGSGIYFPVTINEKEWNNSFVCSPFTAYVTYAKDELKRKIKSKLIQWLVLIIINTISRLLKAGKINKNVHINNYLLSTNPYPNWDGNLIGCITKFIISEFPEHAIIFRSLNEYQHSDLLKTFEVNEYKLIGSRQVYLYDQDYEKWIKHNNNKQDLRIIKNQKLIYLNHEQMVDYLEQALSLYQKLYLEKYSFHNPQFTITYFKQLHSKGTILFQGYRNEHGFLKAFSGLFIIENNITSPLVGYDTNSNQKEALYIHAIQLIFSYKFKSGKVLNLSSGAPLFKRFRGGEASIEYSVIYNNHLNWSRRLIVSILQFVSNKIGIPLMRKYEL